MSFDVDNQNHEISVENVLVMMHQELRMIRELLSEIADTQITPDDIEEMDE